MKTLAKPLHLLLALALVLILTMPAFAAADYSITVTNDPDKTGVSIDGNTYSAYKIFSVTYNTENKAYSYTADASCLGVTYDGKSGSALIDLLSKASPDDVRGFADYVYANYIKDKTPAAGVVTASANATGETASISLASAGYYLVYGTGTAGDATVTASVALTTTDPTATVEPKLSAPTLTKQILHNELNTWGTVGDNQIGDTVNYRTVSSVPDANNYDTYAYAIHDTMSKGLTFSAGSVVVKINDSTVVPAGDYTVTTGGTGTFTVTFKDVKALIGQNNLTSADKFYVYYSAVLNKDAVVYSAGHNDNTAYLEYSNNPYASGEGGTTGTTTPVTVYDWTFTMGVSKVTSTDDALTGAEFVLNTDSASADSPIALINNGDGTYTVAPAGTAGTVTTISAGSAVIKGLDDSVVYYLHETKAPDGYNKLASPVSFQIKADYVSGGNALAAGSPSVSVTMNGETTESSSLEADIVNYTGTELPSTGGTGTKIFYAVGGTLAVGAGVALIARKRVKGEK